LSLAFLNALKLPLENIRGELGLDLMLTGSLKNPSRAAAFVSPTARLA
jgi:hypothetical protein